MPFNCLQHGLTYEDDCPTCALARGLTGTPVDVRGSTHGDFTSVSNVAQEIKQSMKRGRSELTVNQQEALDLIATKIARIVCGNPHFPDHWEDIKGYAELGKQGSLK